MGTPEVVMETFIASGVQPIVVFGMTLLFIYVTVVITIMAKMMWEIYKNIKELIYEDNKGFRFKQYASCQRDMDKMLCDINNLGSKLNRIDIEVTILKKELE